MIRTREVIFEPFVGVLVHRWDAVYVLHGLIHHMAVGVDAFVLARPLGPGVRVTLHRGAQSFDV